MVALPLGGHRKLYHPWTGPYVVLEKLSDVNYKIQHVGNATKIFIVHFDRLKRCTPGTHFQRATLPEQLDHSHAMDVGDNAELLDDDDDIGPPPRYPRRNRRKPDRLIPFVRH